VADLIGASRLDDPAHIETVLRECAQAAGALLLYVYVHHFGKGGGVSGIAVLAESHISVHSWPEYRFAAVDMFMCGSAEPSKAIPVLQAGFQPERIVAQELVRGSGAVIPPSDSCPSTEPPRYRGHSCAAGRPVLATDPTERSDMPTGSENVRHELMRHVYEDIWIGELWSMGDAAGGRALAEDFVDHRPIDAFPNTKSGHIAMALDWHRAFPDYKFVIEDIIAAGDKIIARYSASGTHLGTLFGVPGTGRRVSLTGIDILRFRDDRLAEWWHNENMYHLMRQLTGTT
jgi:S-adenosylmethionine decarboxylase proenzyme